MFMWVDEYTRRDAGVNLSTPQGLKKRNHAERKDLFIHKWHILNIDYIKGYQARRTYLNNLKLVEWTEKMEVVYRAVAIFLLFVIFLHVFT